MQQAIKLREEINALLDFGNYEDALQMLNRQLKSFKDQNSENLFLLAEIAGSYITLGSESYNIKAVNEGLTIFQANRDQLKTYVTEDSIDYCLGNGFHAVYKILSQEVSNFFPTPAVIKDSLFEAKQAYLRAFKKIDLDNLDDFSIQVLTNLGNNLNHSGRIVEALQLFDVVLNYNPEFPQALVSKADGLVYMFQATACPLTISLFSEIYRLYDMASQQSIAIEEVKHNVELGKARSAQFLLRNHFNLDSIETEFQLNCAEYLKHPEDIKFFLDNFLSLSEHSLYCKCNGVKIDDLAIGTPGFVTTNKKIIQLELLNNRLKSEFSLARQLYFEYKTGKLTDNMHYEQIVDHIITGIHHEQLRTSFRLCFGILDKIAEGLCYLFDLEIKDGENIYFESFWNSNRAPERWARINELHNIHLTALYSIACDLNKKSGELGFYKTWRNRLEHGLFSLTDPTCMGREWTDDYHTEKIPVDDFESKTKLLLQMTRAAIFSFVFCARHELVSSKKNGNRK